MNITTLYREIDEVKYSPDSVYMYLVAEAEGNPLLGHNPQAGGEGNPEAKYELIKRDVTQAVLNKAGRGARPGVISRVLKWVFSFGGRWFRRKPVKRGIIVTFLGGVAIAALYYFLMFNIGSMGRSERQQYELKIKELERQVQVLSPEQQKAGKAVATEMERVDGGPGPAKTPLDMTRIDGGPGPAKTPLDMTRIDPPNPGPPKTPLDMRRLPERLPEGRSLAGFRSFFEALDRTAPEDKGKKKEDEQEPMDLFGGEEEELDIPPEILAKIYQTEPQVGAHISFDDLDWKLMPFKIKHMGTHGADIETFGDEVPSRAFKDGAKQKKHGRHSGRVSRKDLADLVGQGWQAVTAGAAAGGAPGGAPGMGGPPM